MFFSFYSRIITKFTTLSSEKLILRMQVRIGIVFMLISLLGKAQMPSTVAYTRDYNFKEGIYLTVEQFKKNSPILKESIVSAQPKTQIDFLSLELELKTITYKDSAGVEQKVETSTLWGYSQNRTIYINFNNEFNRVNVIGTLSVFSGIVIQTPMRNEPIGDMYAIEPSFTELHQFVFDTQSNKVYDFTSKNMELLLKPDAELYTQFMKLKKRAKADSVFIYLRKFNEKHPLYLAVK